MYKKNRTKEPKLEPPPAQESLRAARARQRKQQQDPLHITPVVNSEAEKEGRGFVARRISPVPVHRGAPEDSDDETTRRPVKSTFCFIDDEHSHFASALARRMEKFLDSPAAYEEPSSKGPAIPQAKNPALNKPASRFDAETPALDTLENSISSALTMCETMPAAEPHSSRDPAPANRTPKKKNSLWVKADGDASEDERRHQAIGAGSGMIAPAPSPMAPSPQARSPPRRRSSDKNSGMEASQSMLLATAPASALSTTASSTAPASASPSTWASPSTAPARARPAPLSSLHNDNTTTARQHTPPTRHSLDSAPNFSNSARSGKFAQPHAPSHGPSKTLTLGGKMSSGSPRNENPAGLLLGAGRPHPTSPNRKAKDESCLQALAAIDRSDSVNKRPGVPLLARSRR